MKGENKKNRKTKLKMKVYTLTNDLMTLVYDLRVKNQLFDPFRYLTLKNLFH